MMKSTSKGEMPIYCGVEGSTCNKGKILLDHSLCCLECESNCSNCTVKQGYDCDLKCSKEDIIELKIANCEEEKEALIKKLSELYQYTEELKALYYEV